MYLLFDSASGYALFKLLDESKLSSAAVLSDALTTPGDVKRLLNLVAFQQHESVGDSLAAQTSSFERELAGSLKKFLKKNFVKALSASQLSAASLLVPDPTLAPSLKDAYGIQAVYKDVVVELLRHVKHNVSDLIPKFDARREEQMALGLAHSFARYRVKFNADAIDTMIVQAVALIDDSEKEVNQFSMRLREWMVWHFPELILVVPDNVVYARVVGLLRSRKHLETRLQAGPDERKAFVDALNDASGDRALDILQAASTSVGTEITDADAERLTALAAEILKLAQYRDELAAYISNRMASISPNFTRLVGPLVGARLLAKAGSLMSLAKLPASTIQVLGSERALFRAKKMGSDKTPKYGFIYHAELVSRASQENRGRMARVLAGNASLAVRVDALSDKVDGGNAPVNAELLHFGDDKAERAEVALRFYEGDKAARNVKKAQIHQKMETYRRKEGLDAVTVEHKGTRDMRIRKEDSEAEDSEGLEPAPKATVRVDAEAGGSDALKKQKHRKHRKDEPVVAAAQQEKEQEQEQKKPARKESSAQSDAPAERGHSKEHSKERSKEHSHSHKKHSHKEKKHSEEHDEHKSERKHKEKHSRKE